MSCQVKTNPGSMTLSISMPQQILDTYRSQETVIDPRQQSESHPPAHSISTILIQKK